MCKFRDRAFVRGIPYVERLAAGPFPVREKGEHKVHRIADGRKGAPRRSAVHTHGRFAADYGAADIGEHARNSRAVDARHDIHPRAHEIKGSHDSVAESVEGRYPALRKFLGAGVGPAGSAHGTAHERRRVLFKRNGVRGSLSVDFGSGKMNEPGAGSSTSVFQHEGENDTRRDGVTTQSKRFDEIQRTNEFLRRL